MVVSYCCDPGPQLSSLLDPYVGRQTLLRFGESSEEPIYTEASLDERAATLEPNELPRVCSSLEAKRSEAEREKAARTKRTFLYLVGSRTKDILGFALLLTQ